MHWFACLVFDQVDGLSAFGLEPRSLSHGELVRSLRTATLSKSRKPDLAKQNYMLE